MAFRWMSRYLTLVNSVSARQQAMGQINVDRVFLWNFESLDFNDKQSSFCIVFQIAVADGRTGSAPANVNVFVVLDE